LALRPEYSLVHSEFNDFLFAFVGEEKSGLQLTVLSALARLGFDPWGEAARLSGLTREAATSALATAIARLPEGDWSVSDSRSIAVRLVSCLPRHGRPAGPPEAGSASHRKPEWAGQKWLIWIALAAAAVVTVSRLSGD